MYAAAPLPKIEPLASREILPPDLFQKAYAATKGFCNIVAIPFDGFPIANAYLDALKEYHFYLDIKSISLICRQLGFRLPDLEKFDPTEFQSIVEKIIAEINVDLYSQPLRPAALRPAQSTPQQINPHVEQFRLAIANVI